ncbi:MAG: serine acetyltransferase [Nitrospirae bacterium]|nr:MAG: serine acetyltransferase [Nitrospirota bacterium]
MNNLATWSTKHAPQDTAPTPLWAALKADLARFREEGDTRAVLRGMLSQGFWALAVYRVFRWCYERRIPTQPLRFLVERVIEITTGISIPARARIGKGLRIHHFGGIFIHSDVAIGEQCTVYQGVTIGDLGGWGGVPRIGNRVIIGAGAKVIGPIEIGDDVCIGANAVVRTSVPAGCVAVGVPATIKRRNSHKETTPPLFTNVDEAQTPLVECLDR